MSSRKHFEVPRATISQKPVTTPPMCADVGFGVCIMTASWFIMHEALLALLSRSRVEENIQNRGGILMSIRTGTAGLLLLLSAAMIAAPDNPFVGTWKLDVSKSDFTGETIKFESAGSNTVRYSSGGQSYTFTTDGKQCPELYGRIVSVKQVDANTWERTTMFKSKVLSQTTFALSQDGQTLTETAKGTRPDGSSFEETTVYDRVGEGSGMLGTWKTKDVKENSSNVLEFADNGADGLAFNLPQLKAKCLLKFDGKDYPATGPTVPAGLTLAVTKTGDRSFELTEKIKGKPIFKGTYTVSDDGKTITETGGPVAVNEPTKAVYNRQ
jgi:hypothetical protein